jgi:hypothetical protein
LPVPCPEAPVTMSIPAAAASHGIRSRIDDILSFLTAGV